MVNAVEVELARRFSPVWRTLIFAGGLLAVAMFGSAMPAAALASNGFDEPGSSNNDQDDWPDFDDNDRDDDDRDFDEPDFDNSGPGGGDDDYDHDDNSGPGSGDDDYDQDDNSGPGNGGDDLDQDHGSGSGGDDQDQGDNSGPGNGGDDDLDDEHDNSGPGSGGGGHDNIDQNDLSASEDVIYSVEYDTDGGEYVAGELVFVGSPRDLARARELNFRTISMQALASGGVVARLAIPRGVGLDAARATLRRELSDALVAPNHIYRGAQARPSSPTAHAIGDRRPLRATIGVIDTGIDVSALSDADAVLSHRAFAGAAPVAREHGSMVASIAIAHGARVHVADVFGHTNDGALAASAERVAAALDWMMSNGVAVINISVQGPDNAILAEMVRRAVRRGHIIVAAAGNGGPAARPAFPAAFEGVLAVTAIDEMDRPYIRANRGAYIDFAAPGVDVVVDIDGAGVEVSGTSFAAPIIAVEAAAELASPSPSGSQRALSRLRQRAQDLGAPGRDNIFGWGALGD